MPGKLIDISQPLAPDIAVWPGDTRFKNWWVAQIASGSSVNVGSFTMSLHTGTHADAPLHFAEDGLSIERCSVDAYVGEALVIDASDSAVVQERHVACGAEAGVERLLFKTMTANTERFGDSFSYFSPDAARAIATLRVKLVGIDTPSVDSFDSKTLDSHHILGASGALILENLRLDEIEPGRYELIAVPLKIVGMDASPVRALLRTL